MDKEKVGSRVQVLSEAQAVVMIRRALGAAMFIEYVATHLHHTDSFKSFKMDRVARAARDIIRDLEGVL